MKQKRLTLVIIIMIFASAGLAQLHATGAGVQAGFFPALRINQDGAEAAAFEGNLTGTMSLVRIPVCFGAGLTAGSLDSTLIAGLSAFADYWILDRQLKNNWNLYSGFGASLSLKSDFTDELIFSAGPRFFAGMSWLFIDNYIEFYVQQNIAPAFQLTQTSGAGSTKDFMLYLPFESGLRFHF